MKPSASTPPAPEQGAAHWASLGEHTFVAGIRLLFWVYRFLGRLPFRVCLYPVVIWYWATRRDARAASREYLAQLQAFSGALGHEPGWRDSLRHFLAFADTILDKLLAVRGNIGQDELRVEGESELVALSAQGRGAVIVTAHVGCIELCRISAERHRGVRLNVLVHTRHAERFNRILQRLHPLSEVRFIQVTEISPGTAMLLADKIAQGEYVAIAGDRVPVRRSTTVSVPFLGRDAQWPVGPYVLAALLKCPLYAMACVREPGAGGSYLLQVRRIAEQVVLPRADRPAAMTAYTRIFAGWLEELMLRAPLSWFNFFQFWAKGNTVPAGPAPTPSPTHER